MKTKNLKVAETIATENAGRLMRTCYDCGKQRMLIRAKVILGGKCPFCGKRDTADNKMA